MLHTKKANSDRLCNSDFLHCCVLYNHPFFLSLGQEFPETGTHALSQEEWRHVHLGRVSRSAPHMNSGELCGLLWHSSAHHANVFCYSCEQKRRTLSVKAIVEQC